MLLAALSQGHQRQAAVSVIFWQPCGEDDLVSTEKIAGVAMRATLVAAGMAVLVLMSSLASAQVVRRSCARGMRGAREEWRCEGSMARLQ